MVAQSGRFMETFVHVHVVYAHCFGVHNAVHADVHLSNRLAVHDVCHRVFVICTL